jgi:hypothetical protein
MQNHKSKGICLCRNHKQHGTIFINTNKSNIKYIRQLKDELTNNYSIDEEYVNNDIKLEDVIKIIQNFNRKKNVNKEELKPAPSLAVQNETSSDVIKSEFKITKGRLLGRHNNNNVFINMGKYSPFIKVNGDTKLYSLKHYVDVEKIDLEAAISIINDYKNKNKNDELPAPVVVPVVVQPPKPVSYVDIIKNNIKT